MRYRIEVEEWPTSTRIVARVSRVERESHNCVSLEALGVSVDQETISEALAWAAEVIRREEER